MAPERQATLGQFFGTSGGARPAAPQRQATLSFATKTNGSRAGSGTGSGSGGAQHSTAADTSSSPRRSATPDKKDKKKRLSDEDGTAIRDESDASEPDKPAAKRARKNRRVVEDDDDEEKAGSDSGVAVGRAIKEDHAAAEATGEGVAIKTEAALPAATIRNGKTKSIKKEEPDDAAPLSAAESSSEAENEEEDEEDDEDEEDLKPEVAAKVRKTVQTVLTTQTDAYPDWPPGEPVPYAALCRTFSLIELTTKRLVIMEYCSLFLRQVLRLTPQDMLPTVLLMVNKLAPDYAGIELGIGESLIMKAIGETTGRSLAVIKQDQKEIGDLGLVAVKSRSTQPTMFKPKPLTVPAVHRGLMAIATVTGNGAQQRKVDGIKKLLAAADASLSSQGRVDITKDKGGPSEAKFLIRFLEGKLRLGLAEKTVLVSLAQAVIHHEARVAGTTASTADVENAEAMLKTVYSELPSYDLIIPAMLDHGIMHLKEHCHLRPGIPLKPMLAKPTKAITEVLDRFENQTFTCEYKYDGERAQIHYVAKDPDAADPVAQQGLTAIFSRNSEDLSKKYPDILAKLPEWVKPETKSFVLDCETVAWDVVARKVLPFQQLMTRKRKDVKIADVKIKVCVFAFDLLYLNGTALVAQPLRARREQLTAAFTPAEGEFAFATHMDAQDLDAIQVFLDESVKASCEGLMVKMLDGPESGYEPSKRSRNWLKIKKDYLAGVGDSLDLVVLGAYYGKGKRTAVYGAFLLACRNAARDTYETVCNIGTGFSEAVLEELHAQLSATAIDRPKPFYEHSAGNTHQPDVWFEPRAVWEVRTADLTLSPRYKAAAHEGGLDPTGEARGISLRFPRFIRVRDDKTPDEATTSRQIADMYRRQESVAKSKGPAVDDDFEY
ncbi:DNA ligase (Polydeoxyribonucleotide synthase [ATP]) [Niveomyces insectorum RCEF 264]|uniref:DNA ligase n=1 Tax=Niveomyces insectorum RCEF 264 TaxID=1081102 RepID=A0A167Y250_9HYPO|nr:DNA ligase (Polydeoxyribonucleotide synthase [ATP]) [Niveomyces insectorum RCEF 264]